MLGVFLRSMHKTQTYFTFEDTLSQIGLGYFPLFLLGLVRPRWHWSWLILLLVGYWGLFAWYPLPESENVYAVGNPKIVTPEWPHHYPIDSFEAHWNKNSNAAWAFDRWWLNLFPRESRFKFNNGGYATLSFIPTLGTMILGLICGAWIRRATTSEPALSALPHGEPIEHSRAIVWMLIAGAGCFAVALGVDALGLCPIVKRIWTPTWTLFSGGWCFLFMAAFFAVIDVVGWKRWAFPLVVIGANSIAAYVMAEVLREPIVHSFHIHWSDYPFRFFGDPYQRLIEGIGVLLVNWLILFWMYRRKLFLKI
jgi:predicted acyltransferase